MHAEEGLPRPSYDIAFAGAPLAGLPPRIVATKEALGRPTPPPALLVRVVRTTTNEAALPDETTS